MLIPFNWLKEYLSVSDPKEAADRLTAAGLEIEGILTYKNRDKVLKAEVTPNRGDWLSILGVARELGAILDKKIEQEAINLKEGSIKTSDQISVEIKDLEGCKKYLARYLEQIKVKDSSNEIKSKIDSVGQKPINNIVDATNYTMIALGQPLHAFDAEKIQGNKIIVRFAKKNEILALIDGQKIDLNQKDLVIADQERPIALAGIMGGLDSEVTEKTTKIIIESAWFEPKVIRATAKRHNLMTEASYRFERRVDPDISEQAADLAAKLIQENCEAIVAKGRMIIDKTEPIPDIRLDIEKINQILGLDLKEKEVVGYLNRLGLEINNKKVKVPSWRSDIYITADLAEEVARLYGYSNLPEKRLKPRKFENIKTFWWQKELLKDLLSELGLIEVESYSFLSKQEVRLLGSSAKGLIEVANPVDENINYLRSSLIPGLLRTVAKNPQESRVEIFEIGNVFNEREETRLGIGLADSKTSSAKEIIKKIEKRLKIKDLDWQITKYRKNQLKKFKIKRAKVEMIEIPISEIINKAKWPNQNLAEMPKPGFKYQTVSKYPEVNRDLAFIVNRDLDPNRIKGEIEKISDLIVRVELFDEFTSDRFGKDKKNIAFHLFFQSSKKTLTDKRVDKLIETIVDRITGAFKASLRR